MPAALLVASGRTLLYTPATALVDMIRLKSTTT
jgi:hypothetical protein